MIIPISSLCLDFRDNLLFYLFILEKEDIVSWRRFALTTPNKKIKRGIQNEENNINIRDSKGVVGESFRRLLIIKESIKEKGQITPVSVYFYKDKIYPIDGCKRIASMLSLSIMSVQVVEAAKSMSFGIWDTNHSITGTCFRNMPEDIMIRFLEWRKEFFNKRKLNRELIQNINCLQPMKGHYRCYQGYKKIGVVGQRPVEERFRIYGLKKIMNNQTTVLDIGSNVGCMSLFISNYVREVHGVESYPNFVQISNLIKSYLDVENCFFHQTKILSFKNPYRFDIILSLAAHPSSMSGFERTTGEVYLKMLKKGGYVLIESRGFRRRSATFEQFINYLKSKGFSEEWKGICQCLNSNGVKNQKRQFYVLRKS